MHKLDLTIIIWDKFDILDSFDDSPVILPKLSYLSLDVLRNPVLHFIFQSLFSCITHLLNVAPEFTMACLRCFGITASFFVHPDRSLSHSLSKGSAHCFALYPPSMNSFAAPVAVTTLFFERYHILRTRRTQLPPRFCYQICRT